MNFLKYRCKNNYINIFILGFITAFVIFIPFIIYDNGLFLYYGDFDVQQIPFYRLAHDAIREGNIMWNWNTDLGANFIGSYSFYLLGSPFFWITLLFPSTAVPYLMAPLLMLKFALTAVTGYAYINRFTKFKNTAMIGGLIYAFSGFNVYNIFFNHFNEVVLVFPLLLIALEELVINNRRGGFALCVGLCAMINYYFFFGQVIFVVLYFIIRCTSKDFKVNFKIFMLIVFESVIGLLLSAFLLLPAILSITGNSRIGDTLTGFDMIIYNNAQRYGLILSSFLFPPDIPARPNFFPDSNAKWSSVSMFLPLLSIAGVVAFFKGHKDHWAKKLIIASVIISLVPILNAAFSAFNYSYYARWFYMPLLIMAMVSCIALESNMKHFKYGLIFTSVLVFAFSLIGILPKKVDGKLVYFKLPAYPERFWAYVAIAIIGLLVTGVLYVITIKHKNFMKIAISSIMIISVIYSTFMIFTGKLAGEGYDTVATKAINGRDNINLNDDSFYRIDTFDELDNLGMHWNMPTINAFHSVVPPSIMDYYDAIDGERGVASRPKPNFIGVRALTSVKYSFVKENKKDDKPMVGFELWDSQNGYKIYKNENFVPMGFTYDYFLTEEQLNSCAKEYKDRLLLKGILIDNKDYDKYKDLMPVLQSDKAYDEVLDEENYFADCKNLATNAGYEFNYDKKGFTAKIDSDKKNLMFFSVPYESGWTALVNEKPVDVIKANKGFMAVPVETGENTIRFMYKTPGAGKGILISIIAGVILILYIVYVRKLRKQYPNKYYYDKYKHLLNNCSYPQINASEAYIENISNED